MIDVLIDYLKKNEITIVNHKDNINVIELNSILWAREILDNQNKDYPRINTIKDSQYELNNQIDKYIELYIRIYRY